MKIFETSIVRNDGEVFIEIFNGEQAKDIGLPFAVDVTGYHLANGQQYCYDDAGFDTEQEARDRARAIIEEIKQGVHDEWLKGEGGNVV